MELSDYVVEYVSSKGIRNGFFMIGGAVAHLADAFYRKKFNLYTMHHEQAAAFAAEADATASRGIGLAMATSGPGATNLVTGIASAYFASIPVLFITGQVNTYESNLDGRRRQVGFQETDIVRMVSHVTKFAVLVDKPETIVYNLEKAIWLSSNGRFGPVLLDLPFNVQKADIDPESQAHFIGSEEHKKMAEQLRVPDAKLKEISAKIASSQRPVILLGHGTRLSNAENLVAQLSLRQSIPVVTSLLATDSIAHSDPLFYGFIGTYGQRYSNFALANSDLVIVLGSRLDSRQTGVDTKAFAPNACVIHVDIDKNERKDSLGREYVFIHSDVSDFLNGLLPLVPQGTARADWLGFLNSLKGKYPSVAQKIGANEIDPVAAIEALSMLAKEGDTVAVDVGLNQMWFAQGWRAKKNQTVMSNGGMGPMGWALPACIGASISQGGRVSWMVSGDGGMQINIQELQTVKRNNLPIKMIVLNNNALGMLTQFQSENYEGRLAGSVDGYDAPDFAKVASAYGIPSLKISEKTELGKAFSWLGAQKGAGLVELRIPREYVVYPKASYSRPISDMKPWLEKGEYNDAMNYGQKKQ
jgi:acetolactate synthase I/II/III large subunit